MFSKYSFPFCCFCFHTFSSISCRGWFLMKSILPVFSLVGYALVVYLKTHYQTQNHLDFFFSCILFSSLFCIPPFFLFYSFTFRSLTYFELIFVKVVKVCVYIDLGFLGERAVHVMSSSSSTICWKGTFFLHWIAFAFSKISWLYPCGFISGHTIQFMDSFFCQ